MESGPQQTHSLSRTTRCPHCGASLEITPDAIIFVCQYCGWAGSAEGLEAKGYLMILPLPRAQVEGKATQYLKSQLNSGYARSAVTEAKYVSIPFWRVDVWAHTWFNGYSTRTKTETYQIGKQTHTRSYTVYVPEQGEWTDQLEFKTVARKNAVFFGLDEITSRTGSRQTVPLDPKMLVAEKMQVLDIEISKDEAEDSGSNYAQDQHLSRARSRTSKLFDCRTDTRINGSTLTLYPVYSVHYQFEGRTYRMTFDGADGEVVKAELPLTRGRRLTYAAVSYFALLGLSLLSLYLYSAVNTRSVANLLVVGSVLAVIPLFFATAAQRVQRRKF